MRAELVDENTLDVNGVVFARVRKSKAVVTVDGATDNATGRCECGECGKAIDPWDAWCRWCGAKVGDEL